MHKLNCYFIYLTNYICIYKEATAFANLRLRVHKAAIMPNCSCYVLVSRIKVTHHRFREGSCSCACVSSCYPVQNRYSHLYDSGLGGFSVACRRLCRGQTGPQRSSDSASLCHVQACHGSIIIAILNAELTVKRLYRRKGIVRLEAANPAYPAIEISDESDLCCWGVVTAAIHQFDTRLARHPHDAGEG